MYLVQVIPENILHLWEGKIIPQVNLFHPVLANTNNVINP